MITGLSREVLEYILETPDKVSLLNISITPQWFNSISVKVDEMREFFIPKPLGIEDVYIWYRKYITIDGSIFKIISMEIEMFPNCKIVEMGDNSFKKHNLFEDPNIYLPESGTMVMEFWSYNGASALVQFELDVRHGKKCYEVDNYRAKFL